LDGGRRLFFNHFLVKTKNPTSFSKRALPLQNGGSCSDSG
jgi:hypothetical protein